ncbi:MAG: hypothetical protein KDC87_07540 [Planctomycetes bacterium]|nr:hypothetical protein [Planctomycetota bacterium]
MLRMVVSVVCLLGLGACASAPDRVPGDFDRPAVVRGFARAGTYLGMVPGAVATVVLWPFTKLLNLLRDEPLGYSEREWTLLPLTACASAGHYLIGGPAELVYQVVYGIWVPTTPPAQFDDANSAAAGRRP